MSSKHRILIVDDEPLNVKLFAAILASDSYEIIRAFNGEEALKLVQEENPDLILLDIMMPGIDGFEVTRRLKGHSETKDIPIILITAFDVADYKVIGYEAGADEFLNKPIKAPELKSRVKSLLSTKNYQDALKLKKQADADECSDFSQKAIHEDHNIPLVLLVFEEENDAKSIEMFLHGQPCQVNIEKTAKDAIALSNQKQIDLILLDAMLQREDCFEISGRLKAREQTANTQILIVSDAEFLENKHEQLELWSDDFLIKPVNVHELRARVKALLKKKRFLDRLYAGPTGSVRSAITDRLSGLANFSYFKHFLEHEIKRSQRGHNSLALIVMEPADIKRSPNCVGHLAGEESLKELGEIIKKNIRDVDLAARYKEKQFAIVIADTDENGAALVAKRLKRVIQDHFSKDKENISPKRSRLNIGIAFYPFDADSIGPLIDQAEKELFKAKSDDRLPN